MYTLLWLAICLLGTFEYALSSAIAQSKPLSSPGNTLMQVIQLGEKGQAKVNTCDLSSAEKDFKAAEVLAQTLEDKTPAISVIQFAASAYQKVGNLRRAVEYYRRAHELAVSV